MAFAEKGSKEDGVADHVRGFNDGTGGTDIGVPTSGSSADGSSGSDEKPASEGLDAWLKVLGTFFLFFNIWGIPMSFGAFQSFYTLNYLEGASASAISWIGTVQAALLVASGFVAGPLFDLGYWRSLVIVGGFLTVFGMMMLSISTKYYQIFLSQGIVVGLGCGMFYVPCMSLLGNNFSKNRAIALGVSTSGIALGGTIYTLVYLQLVDEIGFGWTVRTMAFISLGIFLFAGPLVLTKNPTPSTSVRSLFDKSALTDMPFLLFSIAQFFGFLGYLVPLFYVSTFAEVVFGTSEKQGLYVLVGAQAASLFGRIFASIVARRVGAMLPWVFCCAISGILCFVWIAVSSLGGLIAFAVLYGFFSGALIALPPGLFPKICPDPAKMGSRMGVSWMATALATLVGGPIGGALVHLETANFIGVQAWSGSVLLTSVVILLVLWTILGRRNKSFLV